MFYNNIVTLSAQNLSLSTFFTHTLNVFSFHVYLFSSVIVSDIRSEYMEYKLRMYFFNYQFLTELCYPGQRNWGYY